MFRCAQSLGMFTGRRALALGGHAAVCSGADLVHCAAWRAANSPCLFSTLDRTGAFAGQHIASWPILGIQQTLVPGPEKQSELRRALLVWATAPIVETYSVVEAKVGRDSHMTTSLSVHASMCLVAATVAVTSCTKPLSSEEFGPLDLELPCREI